MYKLTMLKVYQQTISRPITFEGIGLHTGKKSKIRILPSTEDKGIVFKRIDIKGDNLIKANYNNVTSAKLCTTLENSSGIKVSTVEHLLAALYISEIDNALIEIDNEEIPIMDGSAKEFLKKLQGSEKKQLLKKRKYLKIINKLEINDKGKKISLEPNNHSFEIDFKLSYANQIIGDQKNCVNFQNDNLEQVVESRTFCLYEDIEKIKSAGLAKGGSLENAVVVDENKILNPDGLRNKKEFVNHKILDLAGDFLLSGNRVLGKIVCEHGGHELTNRFLRKLFSDKSFYKVVEFKDVILRKKASVNSSIGLAVNA